MTTRRNSPSRSAARWPFLGQERLGYRLLAALQADQLPPSVLFAGPAQLGKRSAARWLARFDRCLSAGRRPCDHCLSCRQLAVDQHPQVSTLTANNDHPLRIDAIRQATRSFPFRLDPSERRWLIILHAELMTESASNALLKFLEESPAGVMTVLTTNNLAQLPATIVSRSAVYFWHLVPPQKMITQLRLWLVERALPPTIRPADIIARAAGRPGLLHRLAQQPQVLIDELELLAVFFRAFVGREAAAIQSLLSEIDDRLNENYFHLWELGLRELLLAKLNLTSRRLWPSWHDRLERYIEDISLAELLARSDRWLERFRLFHHHVAPRLVAADLLA
ncbi:MAG: hypothetical protein HYY50_02800 [Candidatus Kerfeldbacteria bacterium]|nr:hypothetical protein [Candidatus Kerfeldbacteria bacterium]